MQRENEASRRLTKALLGTCHASSTWEDIGGMCTRSNGPSPKTWYAIETSPLLA